MGMGLVCQLVDERSPRETDYPALQMDMFSASSQYKIGGVVGGEARGMDGGICEGDALEREQKLRYWRVTELKTGRWYVVDSRRRQLQVPTVSCVRPFLGVMRRKKGASESWSSTKIRDNRIR